MVISRLQCLHQLRLICWYAQHFLCIQTSNFVFDPLQVTCDTGHYSQVSHNTSHHTRTRSSINSVKTTDLCSFSAIRNTQHCYGKYDKQRSLAIYCYAYFPPNATTCPYRLCGPRLLVVAKCNRFLSCPDDVTYIRVWSTRRGLKPKFYKLPRPWSLWESSTTRENFHGRAGNRTWDLMVGSEKFRPPSREAGHCGANYGFVFR
jgi:hypothetical protein